MEAQSCIARLSPPHAYAICSRKEFKSEFATTVFQISEAMNSGPLVAPRQSPLSPNQAFAKGKGKIANLSKSAKQRPVARKRHVNVLVVDDVADVTEMI